MMAKQNLTELTEEIKIKVFSFQVEFFRTWESWLQQPNRTFWTFHMKFESAAWRKTTRQFCTWAALQTAWWRSQTSGPRWWAWTEPETNPSATKTEPAFRPDLVHFPAATMENPRLTSLTVFWFRTRMISAEAPRTKARFIWGGGTGWTLSTKWSQLTSSSYFTDDGVSEGLLLQGGHFAVVHLHENHSNPDLLLLQLIFIAPFVQLRLLISHLRRSANSRAERKQLSLLLQ